MAESKQGSQGSVFISYSRKDKAFVQKLNDALDNSGIQAWVDWEGIELAADWMQTISSAIQGQDAFLFVISPDSLNSKVCAEELELALKLNKKLIPILHREPAKDQGMHPKLAATNWVYMRKDDPFEEMLPKVIQSIQTDLEWVSRSTQLLNQAAEWERRNRNNSFLLQGTGLEDAEKWMADASAREHREVLPMQAEFIRASRKGAERRQRTVLAGVSAALAVSIVLSVLAVFARNDAKAQEALAVESRNTAVAAQAIAEENRNQAEASRLEAEANQRLAEENQKQAENSARLALAARSAAEAQNLQTNAGQLDTSTLLAIESYNINPTDEAENLIRSNASLLAAPVRLMKQDGAVWNIEWSPDYSRFVTGNNLDTAIENAQGRACVYAADDGAVVYCVTHPADINDALFTKDGSLLVTAGADQTVRFWNAADGSPVKTLTFGGAVLDLDISDTILAIGREDNFLTLYYLDKPDLKPVDVEQAEGVRTVKFAPNGDFLAFGLQNGRVRFWQRRSNGYYNGPIHEKSSYVVLAWSPDSNWVVSGGGDSRAKFTKRDGTYQYEILHEDWVEGVAYGNDETWFVTVSDDNKVRVLDSGNGSEWFRMSHTNFAQKVAVSADGQWIASTGYDRVVRIWDSVSGTQSLEIPLKANGSSLAFNRDGTRIVAADEDGNIGIWDISRLKTRVAYIEFPEFVREARFTPSGETLIVNSDDFIVRRIPASQVDQITDGTLGEVVLTTESLTYETAVSPDSNWIAVAELDTENAQKNRATLVNLDGTRTTLLAHGGTVTDVGFLNDSLTAATSGVDGRIVFWEIASGREQFELDNLEPVESFAISPDGSLLAAGLHDKTRVWDLAAKKELIPDLAQAGDIVALAFSPDGSMLATASADGTALLWRVAGGRLTAMGDALTFVGSRRMMLAFSPDGGQLAGGAFGFAYLWDTSTVEEVTRIPHGSNPVTSVSFTTDGSQLLTVSRKVVRVWDIASLPLIPGAGLIEYACSRLTANLSIDEWTTYFGTTPYHFTCAGLPEKE